MPLEAVGCHLFTQLRDGVTLLSASRTRTGNRKLSDVAILIDAGKLFAGYECAIGTMWSIEDSVAQARVAKTYTSHFSGTAQRLSQKPARVSLIGRLRESKA